MKRIGSLLLVIIMLFSLTSCLNDNSGNNDSDNTKNHSTGEYNSSEGEGDMKLTSRQMEILKQENLPTDYSKLNDSQKKAIIAIEELFCYLDNKYEAEFVFIGYRSETALDIESLIVQPKGATPAESFSVFRDNGIITDNYSNIQLRDDYEEMLEKQFKAHFSNVDVFSDIEEVVGSDTNELRSCVYATTGIYAMKTDVEGKDIIEIARNFGNWYSAESKGVSCSFSLYVVPDDIFWSLTRFNRTSYDENVIQKVNITIRANGSVIVK